MPHSSSNGKCKSNWVSKPYDYAKSCLHKLLNATACTDDFASDAVVIVDSSSIVVNCVFHEKIDFAI
jgi:hypothetical protein